MTFNIGSEHVRALEMDAYRRFIKTFSTEAQQSWPKRRQEFDTDEQWRQEISRLVEIARKDGLEIEREVRAHVAITLQKGPAFWTQPDVMALLRQPDLSTPTLKILAVLQNLKSGTIW